MGVETLMAKEAISLIGRKPTRLPIIIGMYLVSLRNHEVSHTGRAAYFFIRHVDDFLDGDLKLEKVDEPLSYVSSLKSQIESGIYTGKPKIIKLAEKAIGGLEKKAQAGDNPKQEFLNVIDAMIFDHQRSKERKVLTAKQLGEYYQHSLFPIHNLMLIGLGSKFRAIDIPEMLFCEARIFTIKHLKSDWNTGIFNIPEEILLNAGLTLQSSYREIIESSIIKSWFQSELQKSKFELISLQAKLKTSNEKLTVEIYSKLINSMLWFVNGYSNPAIPTPRSTPRVES